MEVKDLRSRYLGHHAALTPLGRCVAWRTRLWEEVLRDEPGNGCCGMWFGGGRRNGAMHEQLKGIFPLNPLTNILHKHAKRSLFTNAFHDHTSRTRFTITLHEHALRSHFTNMLHEHASRYVFLFHPLPCLRAPDKHANAKEILNGLAKPRSVWLLQPSMEMTQKQSRR